MEMTNRYKITDPDIVGLRPAAAKRSKENPDSRVSKCIRRAGRAQKTEGAFRERPSTLTSRLIIEPGRKRDFLALADYHYCGSGIGPISAIFVLRERHPVRRIFADPVGVIVYQMPLLNLAGRNVLFGEHLGRGRNAQTRAALINANVRCISRVILDPRYRGLGLAVRLVQETIHRLPVKLIEAKAVMGRISPFFEKAGMTRADVPEGRKRLALIRALEEAGIGMEDFMDVPRVHRRIEQLDPQTRELVDRRIQNFLGACRSRAGMPHSAQRTSFVLARLGPPALYYWWMNPNRQWIRVRE